MRPKPTPPRAPQGQRSPATQTLRLDDIESIDGAELQHRLIEVFRSPRYKPPVLPNIAFELTELSRKKTVSYDEVGRVLEKDPLIVASVLKLAQSPLYGGRLPVQSLREALNRLGVNKLRDLVWEIVMDMRLFRVEGHSEFLARLQSHATFTAHASRIVAQQAGVAAEHAFLSGLLHDVGWSGALIAISESAKNTELSPQLLAAIDNIHAEAGAAMAKLWGLSEEILILIRHHHEPKQDGKPVSLLVHILCVAERLADEFGFGVESRASTEASEPRKRLDGHASGRYETALIALRLADQLELIKEQVEQAALRIDGGDFGG